MYFIVHLEEIEGIHQPAFATKSYSPAISGVGLTELQLSNPFLRASILFLKAAQCFDG